MNNNSTIVVTGAAGFIASCVVQFLNKNGFSNLILVDDFGNKEDEVNWVGKKYLFKQERQHFFKWLDDSNFKIDFVIHLGARTDTTEFDYAVHEELNLKYSQNIWNYCSLHSVPLIYASSAATYGDGSLGYIDDHELVDHLKPLNPYGISKNEFDKWAVKQSIAPPCWAGLKFFNVYGPNEYHKKRMASVIFHSFNQIDDTGFVKLFKSHRADFNNGEQLRDFIYVKDICKVIYWMLQAMFNENWSTSKNGLYNLGTGKARTFVDLVSATYKALNKKAEIVFVDMPADIRDNYQYFTEAKMDKLTAAGYTDVFFTLEEGIDDYIKNYLIKDKIY